MKDVLNTSEYGAVEGGGAAIGPDGVGSDRVGSVPVVVVDETGSGMGSKRNGSAHGAVLGPMPNVVVAEAFTGRLEQACSFCRERSISLAVVVVDVEGGRVLRGAKGGELGNRLLSRIGQMVAALGRPAAFLNQSRWGEFTIVLPGVGESEAETFCDTLRQGISRGQSANGERRRSVIVYCGVAEQNVATDDAASLLSKAEDTLVAAKQSGGDATVCWSSLDTEEVLTESLTDASWAESAKWQEDLRSRLHQAHAESTWALLAAVEAKDMFVRRHSLAVAHYCRELSGRMGLGSEMCNTIQTAAMLHDLGKIGVPDAILNKPGPLTDEEFAAIKRHPQIGVEIVQCTTFLSRELPVILHHHERYDGSGYPHGLKGDSIPLAARILNVADALDAMLSRRSYKKPYRLEQVVVELERGRGSHFDPVVADVALRWLRSEGAGGLAAMP